MFEYAANHPKNKGSLKIRNNQELTPTNLAAMLGRKEIFVKLIESIKMVTQNIYVFFKLFFSHMILIC
jgi:hypothetical protein